MPVVESPSTRTAAPRSGPRRRLLRLAMTLLVTALVLYAVVLVAAYLLQRRLIYFPERLDGRSARAIGGPGEIVRFPSQDGTRVSGLYVAPRDSSALVVLAAHGNAGNVLTWRPLGDRFIARGMGALLLDPRGYGLSDGSPTEEGCAQDAEAAVRWLGAKGVVASRLVVVGVSIGSGLAVPIAAKHPVRGLILESPFTSLLDAACDQYRFLPCRLLLRDRYDNVTAAAGVRCPVLIVHGTSDSIVSVAHARRLAAAFPVPPTLCLAEGFDHNDVSSWPGYDAAVAEFLDRLPK